jgi:hypothetical protein
MNEEARIIPFDAEGKEQLVPGDVLAEFDKLMKDKDKYFERFKNSLTEEAMKDHFEDLLNVDKDKLERAIVAYNLDPKFKEYIKKEENAVGFHLLIDSMSLAESVMRNDEYARKQREKLEEEK